MKIQLSDRFTYSKLFRFTLPSVIMMVFTSIYGVVDGFFVSNFVGKTPFAAVNFIMPVLMILGTVGFMFGAGGSALMARTMGQGDDAGARRLFSLFVYVTVVLGVILGALGFIFLRPIAAWLGAEGEMLENCVLYGRIILPALPALMLQYEFQSFFITAERPQLGLIVTVIAGVANMVLDALLTAVFPFGLGGAALATAISQSLGGIIPLFYFGRENSSRLRLCRTTLDWKALLKACTNGSSELMSNISMSVVGMLYNGQLIRYAGEDGVAAYGVLMYVSMIFMAIFIGYSTGMAPVVSFHFGADNRDELRSLYRKSLVIILSVSGAMLIMGEALARPLSAVFVGYDPELMAMTEAGFHIFALSFIFNGFNIFGSSFFAALGNGKVASILSFMRTFLLKCGAILLLPLVIGLDGIWWAVVVAEGVAAVLTLYFLVTRRKKYHYA